MLVFSLFLYVISITPLPAIDHRLRYNIQVKESKDQSSGNVWFLELLDPKNGVAIIFRNFRNYLPVATA
jgi:hypothetical protein